MFIIEQKLDSFFSQNISFIYQWSVFYLKSNYKKTEQFEFSHERSVLKTCRCRENKETRILQV